MRKHSLKLLKNVSFLSLSIIILITGIIIVWISTLKIPDFKLFTERKIQSSTKIYDRTGEILLYDVHQNIKRTIIPYEEMGANIKNATVAIEDAEFYNHKGIRITSIIRGTIWAKLTGKKIQGGSTITQQLIKNTLLTPEVSIKRKIKEWILAVKLEKIMSKEDILALYLNEAPYGGNIYGIEEASLAFFNKKPLELTLAESAYLAAIPNGPTYYSPYRKNRDKLEERKNLVLKRMLDLKFISEDEYSKAKNEKVVFQPERPMNIAAPHFVFFIKEYLENKYGINALESGGLKVTTTLDYNLQKTAEQIILEKSLENEKNWNGKNAGAVVIDPKTGQILAMVGSRNYFDKTIDGNFNVATALRQPGSSFKPIIYAKAFEKGYTSETVLFDVKTEFNSSCDPNGNPLPNHKNATCYSPSNYDDNFRGPMTLKNALAQSINVIAVKLMYLVGIEDSIQMAKDLGITTLVDKDRYGLSLVIGGGETTLLEMASAYGVFANNGIRNPYTGIISVLNDKNEKLEEYENKQYQVIDSNITNILSDILSDEESRVPTFGRGSVLNIPGREVAVKTGTTNNNKDAWTIGYTPSVVVGVWVGNNDNTPMKKGGVALAGPIWNGIITEALKNKPVEFFEKPEEINQSLPPFLRGYWQINGSVHTILHWLNKNNPQDGSLSGEKSDPQYPNWEYGVSKWWSNNFYLHKNENINYNSSINENTYDKAPSFNISGLSKDGYKLTDNIIFKINQLNDVPIKKIDVYINNIYIKSIKNEPYIVSFTPQNIQGLSSKNNVYIIGYNESGQKGEFMTELEIIK